MYCSNADRSHDAAETGVCKGEADFKQFGLQSGKAVDLCGEWEFFEQKFIATELDEEQVFGKFVRVPSYMPRKMQGCSTGEVTV